VTEQSIGTARIDVVVDASQLDVAITAGKRGIDGMSQSAQAAYAQLNSAEKKRVDSLRKQADTIGFTRQQMVLYNAAAKGLPNAVIEDLKTKMLGTAQATKSLADNMKNVTLSDSQLLKANQALAGFKAKADAAAQAAAQLGPKLSSVQFSDSQLLRVNQALATYQSKAAAAAQAAESLRQAQAATAMQSDAASEGAARLQQEASIREKVWAQTRAALVDQQRLAAMRADALHAFGPELDAQERETAAMQRANGVRERLTAFLATERGQRVLDAEAIRNQNAAYTAGSAAAQRFGAGANAALSGTAKTAKELQFAMRGVPAQLTDIFVGLSTGQRPLTILLQQGGQLKDMFGGIAPAAKALGSSLLGLINPYTLVAAAAGGLLLAWKAGSDEADAYSKALRTTGGYAGVTAGQLKDMAEAMGQSVGTQHEAAAALAAVAASGKFTGSQLELVARAALDMSRLTGQATSETIQQFAQLKADPVKAILALNDARHFLTLSTYEHIKALQDEGKQQEAATLAMKTYADANASASKGVVQDLGTIERAWNAVKDAIKGAIDASLNVGRSKSLGDQAAALQDQIEQLKGGRFLPNGIYQQGLSENSPQIQDLRKKISDIYTKAMEEASKARGEAAQKQLVQDKADSDREVQEFATNAQKRATELAQKQGEYNARIARALAAGNKKLADDLRASEKLVLAGINEKYKDPKKAKDPEVSAYQTFKGQVDALDVKTITGDDSALTKYQQGIRQLADEMSVYMQKGGDATKAAALFNRGQKDLAQTLEQNRKQETDAEKAYAAALEKSNQALALQVNNEIARIGMGEKEYQRTQEIAQAYRDQAAALADLALKRQMGADGQAGGISQDQYDADVKAQRTATEEKVRILRVGYARMDAAQGDWVNGARKAYQDWIDQASDVAGQTNAVFSNAFDSMADSMASFVTTGKFGFKDMVKSILSDLAKMEMRILASKILQSVLGAFLGGNRTTGAGDSLNGGANYTGNGSLSTSWPGMSGGWSTNAKGGVYASPSLSSYSNGVYNSPQVFAFAKGAGVFAEAGPEAIMPLRRGADGKLGVAAAGVGGMGDITVNVQVNQNSDGSSSATADVDALNQFGKSLGEKMKVTAQQEIQRALRPNGQIDKAMKGRVAA
jgi:lambda family phage tail tape measure protein